MTFMELWIQISQTGAAWLAAVGTVSAVGVALYLSRADARTRERERKLMRGVLIRLIDEELNRITIATSNDLLETLKGIKNDKPGSGKALHHITALNHLAERFELPVTKEYFRLLPAIGEHDCFKVASALVEVSRLNRSLNTLASQYLQLQTETFDGYLDDINSYRSSLIEALQGLSWVKTGELRN